VSCLCDEVDQLQVGMCDVSMITSRHEMTYCICEVHSFTSHFLHIMELFAAEFETECLHNG